MQKNSHSSFSLFTCAYALVKDLVVSTSPYKILTEPFMSAGGAERNRTVDIQLAKLALYQLSYGPAVKLVGLGRFELPTPRLSSACSNQLSYRPERLLSS